MVGRGGASRELGGAWCLSCLLFVVCLSNRMINYSKIVRENKAINVVVKRKVSEHESLGRVCTCHTVSAKKINAKDQGNSPMHLL